MTTGQRHVVVVAVAPFGGAHVHLALDAGELLVQHDVDRAGDGVRAIGRRSAAGDHVGALDQAAGNEVEVDRAFTGDRREAAVVDQHQVAVNAQTAQVHDLRADVEAAPAVIGGGVAGLEGRQLADRGTQVGDVQLFEGRGIELRDRRGGAEAGADQARTGDHDLLQLVNRCALGRHYQAADTAAGQNGDDAGTHGRLATGKGTCPLNFHRSTPKRTPRRRDVLFVLTRQS